MQFVATCGIWVKNGAIYIVLQYSTMKRLIAKRLCDVSYNESDDRSIRYIATKGTEQLSTKSLHAFI